MAKDKKIKKPVELRFGLLLGLTVSVAVLFTFIITLIGGVYIGVTLDDGYSVYNQDNYDEMKTQLEAEKSELEAELEIKKDELSKAYDLYMELGREFEEYKESNVCSTTFEEYETQIDKHTKETINMTLTILEASHKNDACVNYLRGEYQNNETFQNAYDSFLDSYYEMDEVLELT